MAVIPDFAFAYSVSKWQRVLPNYYLTKGASGENGEGNAWVTRWKSLGRHSEAGLQFETNLIAKWMPASIVAEQYRVAATRLALIRTKPSMIVVITSAVKGEGKTTTVVNLGYTLARDLGKRTLLIDCDFKCPVLDRFAEIAPECGLADCLIGDVSVNRCISGFPEVPCSIMPIGNGDMHSGELLRTERLSGVLEQLREQFDYILINAPPILPLADMNVLASHADVLLLVVKAGSTPQHFVRRALMTVRADVPIHVILNAVGRQSLPNYMNNYYDYLQTRHV